MPFHVVDGPQGRLAYSDGPGDDDGVPVMFLHSDCGERSHWDGMRAHLFPDHPTAAFDRRGHGQSEPPRNGAFDERDAAADVAAVADALGWSDFVLVAHSGGALVAYAFAALHPERVRGLLLVDPPVDASALPPGVVDDMLGALRREDWRATLERYYRSIVGPHRSVQQHVLADLRATPQATAIGAFTTIARFSAAPYAGRYDGPALSVVQSIGNVDGALHRVPPGMPHAVVDGVGHWIHLGAPDTFAQLMTRFIEEASRT